MCCSHPCRPNQLTAVVAVALYGLASRLLADDEADVDARHGARPLSLLSLRSCLFGNALTPPLCVDCISVIDAATAIMDALLTPIDDIRLVNTLLTTAPRRCCCHHLVRLPSSPWFSSDRASRASSSSRSAFHCCRRRSARTYSTTPCPRRPTR
mmetsp:Transcript_31943/g.68058  ORF Transcript_31943/g.68058 Transcript_31943/m.68058 type:complete len:154 (+) Transcript_31943:332-793(+)